MDFALMFCPYCGGTVDSSDESRYVCQSCGKSIYTDRENIRAFIRPGELEDRFNESLDAAQSDNPKKALAIADDLIALSEEKDGDAFFLRGAIYAYMGEDGKAAANWKKGLELLTTYTNVDAYVCLVSKSISDMIYLKEKEYIEFDLIKYIDRICEEFYTHTGESCKAFIYYTIFRDYNSLMGRLEAEGEETFTDVVPKLFRRVVAYHHNYKCLTRIISEHLAAMGYNPETYEEDDNAELHVYDLIRQDVEEAIAGMTDDEIRDLIQYWDDAKLKDIEERLQAMMPHAKGGVLSKVLGKGKAAEEPKDIEEAAREYTEAVLHPSEPEEPSDNPEMVE